MQHASGFRGVQQTRPGYRPTLGSHPGRGLDRVDRRRGETGSPPRPPEVRQQTIQRPMAVRRQRRSRRSPAAGQAAQDRLLDQVFGVLRPDPQWQSPHERSAQGAPVRSPRRLAFGLNWLLFCRVQSGSPRYLGEQGTHPAMHLLRVGPHRRSPSLPALCRPVNPPPMPWLVADRHPNGPLPTGKVPPRRARTHRSASRQPSA